MKEVAKLQIKDRTELFQATAISQGAEMPGWELDELFDKAHHN